MRGRPRKPTKLKLLNGNPGRRPLNDKEPAPKMGAKCPSWLSKEAKARWKRWAPEMERLGLLTVADEAAFAIICQAWADYRRCVEYLNIHGSTYESESGYSQSRPEVAQKAKAEEAFAKFGSRFGLDPSSRSKMQNAAPEEADPFDEFLKGVGKKA